MRLLDLGQLLKDSWAAYWDSKPTRLAAAISFYAAFSLAPLTILAVLVTSWYARDFNAYFSMALSDLLGSKNAATILGLVSLIGEGEWDLTLTAAGLGSLLFGATGLFVEVQGALNTIWNATIDVSWKAYLRQQMWAFLTLITSGALLVLSLLLFALLTTAGHFFERYVSLPLALIGLVHTGTLLLLLTLFFAKAYKFLPDVELRWKDVLLGGAVTSLFFTLGKALMGYYLGRFGLASVYGPAATPMAILFWLYYSSQIFLFGAHFTHVYACRYGSLAPPPGSHLPPRSPARKVKKKRK